MEWIGCHFDHKHQSSDCYLQYINVLSLSNKESVIMSSVIPVYASWSREKLKQYQSSQESFAHWVLDVVLTRRMAEAGGGVVGENGIVDCVCCYDCMYC